MGALAGLGALLANFRFRPGALIVYRQWVAVCPTDPVPRVCLANELHQTGEAEEALSEYRAALRVRPGFALAHQGIGNVRAEQGDADEAARHWALGYRDHVFSAWAYHGTEAPIRVLMPFSVAGGNLRARMLLDDTICAVTAVAIEFWTEAHGLPPHDVVVNAVSDAESGEAALARCLAFAAVTRRPVVNHPYAVSLTGRAVNAARLGRIADVVAPRTAWLSRQALAEGAGEMLLAESDLRLPVLLRSPGFHTGQHFVLVRDAVDLARQASLLPGDAVLGIAYLDAAGKDGLFRKGRVMIVDGGLYPLHWAISAEWKVHYFTAGMAANAEHRAEEAQFLDDMAGFLGSRAMAALGAVATMLKLDYGGIDFALDGAGRILLFEANATMVILPPPEGAMWNYRRGATERAQTAVRLMLQRAGRRHDLTL